MTTNPKDSQSSRRLFSDAAKFALFEAASGRCESCGKELSDAWHGDHLVPWARGGETDVANGQALCPVCNLRKGDSLPEHPRKALIRLRKWQKAARAALHADLESGKTDFLAVATPGAGKTTFALRVAADFLAGGVIDHVVIVTSTDQLKGQWVKAAKRFEIDLTGQYQNRSAARGIPRPRGTSGVVVTYAQVGRMPEPHRLHCSRAKTLVVFDEIHHAGETKAWGDGLRRAFENAVFRLALSGTPFRRDSNPIPFVEYEDGRSAASFSYGYSEALRDDVCRSIVFPGYEGRMEWLEGSGLIDASFADDLNEKGQSRRLRTALSPSGDFLRQMLEDANEHLEKIRAQGHSDAAGLVLAVDQGHATVVAKLLEDITSVRPTVAISDSETASEDIDTFANSDDLWIVAVKMVSEGVDVPRLRVGVYATNIVSELFFRQAVGRFVRVIDTLDEQTAFVYLPKDSRLIRMAREIQDERNHELTDNSQPVSREGYTEETLAFSFLPVGSTGREDGAISAGRSVRSCGNRRCTSIEAGPKRSGAQQNA